MTTKLYKQDEAGIRFESTRRPGEVRIPNYVYDLWLPLLGATYIGVYGMYCRLERQENVSGMSNQRIAKICKIGTTKLGEINITLEKLGFIKTTKPTGAQKVKHFTTVITVCDPPKAITPDIIKEYGGEDTYQPLTAWLIEDAPNSQIGISYSHSQFPNGNASLPKQECDTIPNGNAFVLQPLSLQPSILESNTPYTPMPATDVAGGASIPETTIPEKFDLEEYLSELLNKDPILLLPVGDQTPRVATVAIQPPPSSAPPPDVFSPDSALDTVLQRNYSQIKPSETSQKDKSAAIKIQTIVELRFPDAPENRLAWVIGQFFDFWDNKLIKGEKAGKFSYPDSFKNQFFQWLAKNPQVVKQINPPPVVTTFEDYDDEPLEPVMFKPQTREEMLKQKYPRFFANMEAQKQS